MDNKETDKESVSEQTKCGGCGRRFGEMEDEPVECNYCEILFCPACIHSCYNCHLSHCYDCGCPCLDYTR